MSWDATKYSETCGAITERGKDLIELIKQRNPKRVLDIGCGTGALTCEIANFADEVIGIDSSPSMVERAIKDYPHINFVLCDACQMNYDNYFDVAFSNAVFHFIKNQDDLLKGIHRALINGGLLICEFGASDNMPEILKAVKKSCTRRGKEYSLRFFYPTKEEYDNLLEKYRFKVLSITVFDVDTKLSGGEEGLKNWLGQAFSVEMGWFDEPTKEEIVKEIGDLIRKTHWDGEHWHINNRRIRVIAEKKVERVLDSV